MSDRRAILDAAAIYERIGGMDTFRRLADAFYQCIEQDPLLRPMFPQDLIRPREKQALVLAEPFGGPADYTRKHGKTSLLCRHASFAIGPNEVQAWLGHMVAALDAVGIPEPERTRMRQYFDKTAPALADLLLPFRRLTLEQLKNHLEQSPALVHQQCGDGSTLLHAAAGNWDIDRVTLLLEKGAAVDVGHSPLCNAANRYVDRAERTAETGKVVVEILIRRGADVNRPRGPEAQTPLHMAARRGNLAIAQALLDGGAALEAQDKKGETPLRRAVNCGHPEFVSLLLAYGADVNARDKQGRTPLQAARRPDMVKLLREHGAVE
jgi:hemoglobin